MQTDYPNIRASLTCPCCGKPKDKGCVVCWPCYRFHDFRNGGRERFTTILNTIEARGGQA